ILIPLEPGTVFGVRYVFRRQVAHSLEKWIVPGGDGDFFYTQDRLFPPTKGATRRRTMLFEIPDYLADCVGWWRVQVIGGQTAYIDQRFFMYDPDQGVPDPLPEAVAPSPNCLPDAVPDR
ncbi:MAG: hypothetical protein AAFU65_15855, partial [Pseudomonadota bacterium]